MTTLVSVAGKILRNATVSSTELDLFQTAVASMPEAWSNKQRAFHLIAGNTDQPACKICGATAKFLSRDYWKWCSNQCMGSDPQVLEKKKNTNLKRWGVENPQALNSVKEKQRATLLDRYGVTNFSKSEEFSVQSKKTFTENYGVDNPSKNPEIVEKIRKSAQERNFAEVLRKREETCIEIYGTPAANQRHIDPGSLEKLHDIRYLSHQHLVLGKTVEEIARDIGCSPTPILKRFAESGVDVIRRQHSVVEKEIASFIQQYSSRIETRSRSIIPPKELDIFIPELNCAIEVNGVFWHSETNGKDQYYHKNKTDQCEQAGIQLVHITDSEWKTSRNIIESKIAYWFNQSIKIPARHCTVTMVSESAARSFLVNNHLRGFADSSVNIGLHCNGELLSLAAFNKTLYNKTQAWELVRFCNKQNTAVQGGASKLLAAFIKKYSPQTIVSFADARWATSALYEKLGFVYSHCTEPACWYFRRNNPSVLESNTNFQGTPEEWETLKSKGYDRIWDCGTKVYIWEQNGKKFNKTTTRS